MRATSSSACAATWAAERLFRCDACGWRGWLMPLVSIESELADQAPAPNLAEVDEAVSRSLPAARPHFPAAKPAMTESATAASHRGSAVALAMPQALAVAAVCWGAFAFGGAYPWAYWPLACCCRGGRRGSASARQAPTEVSDRALVGGLALVAAAIVVQLVPLPLAWIGALSPRTLPLLENVDFQYGAGLDPHTPAVDRSGVNRRGAGPVSLVRGVPAGTHADLRRRPSPPYRGGARRLPASLLALAGIVQKPLYTGRVLGIWQPEAGGSPFGPFVNKNHFAGWMLMALPLTMALLCAGLQRACAA